MVDLSLHERISQRITVVIAVVAVLGQGVAQEGRIVSILGGVAAANIVGTAYLSRIRMHLELVGIRDCTHTGRQEEEQEGCNCDFHF